MRQRKLVSAEALTSDEHVNMYAFRTLICNSNLKGYTVQGRRQMFVGCCVVQNGGMPIAVDLPRLRIHDIATRSVFGDQLVAGFDLYVNTPVHPLALIAAVATLSGESL